MLAELLCYDILPAEARGIGEIARHAAVAFKGKPPGVKGKPPKTPADQTLKDTASKAKSKAKADAAKDPALAAELAQRLDDIDAVLVTDRRQLALAVPPLPWPPRNSVIRQKPKAKPNPPAARLAELRRKVAMLQEAVAATDADVVASRRIAERLRDYARKAEAVTSHEALYGDKEDETWAALCAMRNQAQDAAKEAEDEHSAQRLALLEYREALRNARLAVQEEEAEQAAERAATSRQEAEHAKQTRERAEQEHERAEREREDAARLARREELEARLRALQATAPCRVPFPETSQPAARSEPKVFKLTGMDASGIRAMASSVSQAIQGPLEHDESAWRAYERAVDPARCDCEQ